MATYTIRPDGDSSVTGITFGAGSYHYDRVNESSADDTNGVSGGTEKWTMSGSAQSGTITDVAVYARFSIPSGDVSNATASLGFYIGSTFYSLSCNNNGGYTEYHQHWTTNPATSAAWTWDDITGMIGGVILYSASGNNGKGGYIYIPSSCSQFWVVITYTPAPDPPTNVSATENDGSKVVVTWTKSSGATGYRVYRDGSDISGLLPSMVDGHLVNGDLETWADAHNATGWSTAGGGSTIDREATIIKSGTYSAKMTRGAADDWFYQDIKDLGGHNIAYWAGKTITFGAWVYSSAANKAFLYINEGPTAWGSASSAHHTGDSTWQYLTVTHTISASASHVYIIFNCGESVSGYIDCASVVEGTAVWDGANGLCIPYDDTTAAAPVITAGTATASDGTYDDKVSFSLSGNSIADGTKYTYTVKATSDGSTMSAASSSDTGYRKAQTVTYQWQKSTGDATFASFSNISGKTSSSGDDTDAPENGQASPYAARYYKVKISATGLDDVYSTVNHGARDAGGRYYKCALSATGSTTVYSTADRGYRSAPAPESSFIQEIMRVFYTP